MGVSPHTIKHFPGLYTSCNPLAVPEGAQDIADNCVVRSADILESRRGYSAVASPGAVTNAIGWKSGKMLSITYDSAALIGGGFRTLDPVAGTWTALAMNPGTSLPFAPAATTTRVRIATAQKAAYWQGRYGLVKQEATNAFPASHPPLSNVGFTFSSASAAVGVATGGLNNWLANNFQVAYRFTLCRFGANGELIESEPSERQIASNTSGGLGYGFLQPQNDWMIPSDSFLRVYRSVQIATGSAPSDEMFLAGEISSAGAISDYGYRSMSAGYSYSDFTDDTTLIGNPPLYSNLQSGTSPGRPFASSPLAQDFVWFKNRGYNWNTSDVQRLTIKLIGTGSGGVNVGDTITVGPAVFTWATADGTPASGQIKVYTGGTIAQNIDNTARNLVGKINTFFLTYASTVGGVAGAPFYWLPEVLFARYIGSGTNNVGQILIQSLVPGANPFTITTSTRNGWASDYTAGVTSSANPQPAGLSWSELFQPEAWPLSNATTVGDASDAGQRAVALRDAALLYKTNDGVWKVTDDGTSVGPTVTLLDPTVKLIAPDTLQVIDNLAIGLCADGVIAMSEMGKVNLSHDQIERDLFKLMSYVGVTTLQRYAFGVSYAQEHTYLMALPESQNATSATLIYAYNTETHAWTRWRFRLGVLAGSVNPDTGQLVWAMSDGTIWIERKNGDSSDYQDPGFTLTSPVSTATATMVFAGDLTQGATPVETGDVFQQFQAIFALQQRVRSVVYSSGVNQTTVTLDAAPAHAWTATPLTVLKAIRATARFLPFHAEAPMTDKSWGTMFLYFRYFDQDWMTVGFASEKAQIFQNVEQVAGSDQTSPQGVIPLDVWAPTPWANTSASADFWGRRAQNVMLQVSIPQDFNPSAQLGLTLIFANALERWELAGIDLKIMVATHRPVR